MPPFASLARAGALLALSVAASLALAAERSLDNIRTSPDQAWQGWSASAGITAFFAPDAEIEPRVGGAFRIYMDSGAERGQQGADGMRYLALQPKKMLSLDWNVPPSLPKARAQRTFVVVRFEPLTTDATRVSLHHTGWGEGGKWDKAYAYFDRAWGGVPANLQKRYESGPHDRSEWLAQLERYRAQVKMAPAASAAK